MDWTCPTEVPNWAAVMTNRYGPLHHESLKQGRSDVIRELERRGERFRYFRDLSKSCNEMHSHLVASLSKNHPFSEREFGTIEEWRLWLDQVARELVLEDRVLMPDQETEEARRNGYLD